MAATGLAGGSGARYCRSGHVGELGIQSARAGQTKQFIDGTLLRERVAPDHQRRDTRGDRLKNHASRAARPLRTRMDRHNERRACATWIPPGRATARRRFLCRSRREDGRPRRSSALFLGSCERSAHRRTLLREAWKHVGKVFITAVIVDVIYQVIVERWVYPFEALMVGAVLAVLPYFIFRGLVNRILRRRYRGID